MKLSGQAARTSLLAALAVGALGSAPAHAAVKAKAAAAIPCAKSAPVGDAEVEKVVVGRDVQRDWHGRTLGKGDINGLRRVIYYPTD